MDNKKLVGAWQTKILQICEQNLARPLLPKERKFITDTGGFLALEMIENTVTTLYADELSAYLNSGDN